MKPSSQINPVARPVGALGYLRVLFRGVAFTPIAFGCLGILLLVRMVERPIWGDRRPWTGRIPQIVSRYALFAMGIRYQCRGTPMRQPGAVVANHTSWIDIFALNAGIRIFFVAKSEVAGWPLINWFTWATGTIHINRRKAEVREHNTLLENRMDAGNRLLFFPEGTSTEGNVVYPFKTSLFAPFFTDDLKTTSWVQPATVIYHAPEGEEPGFYSWWGEMDLGPHLLKILAAPHQGSIEVIFHPPLRVSDFADRKALANACEEAVRQGMPDSVRTSGL